MWKAFIEARDAGLTKEIGVSNFDAALLDRTPAQVIIRWRLQHEVVVIPKSVNADRIRSNADVGGFELSDEVMATLDGLGAR